jgi:hypothetical protein
MKEITYKGRVFEVEDEATCVATDLNGDIFAYEEKPEPSKVMDEWLGTGLAMAWYLGNYDNDNEYKDWASSREEIK